MARSVIPRASLARVSWWRRAWAFVRWPRAWKLLPCGCRGRCVAYTDDSISERLHGGTLKASPAERLVLEHDETMDCLAERALSQAAKQRKRRKLHD